MKKKNVLMIMGLASALFLAACGSETGNEENQKNGVQEVVKTEEVETPEISEEVVEEVPEEVVEETNKEEEAVKEGYVLFDEDASSIQMQYPDGWKKYTRYDDEFDATYQFHAPKKPREKYNPRFKVKERKNEYENLNAFVEDKFDYDTNRTFAMIEDKKIQIDGKEAVYRKYTLRASKSGLGLVDVNEISVFVLNGERAYEIILFGTYDDLMEKYEHFAIEMINSIKFKEVEL